MKEKMRVVGEMPIKRGKIKESKSRWLHLYDIIRVLGVFSCTR
jgi:hypothetical protein